MTSSRAAQPHLNKEELGTALIVTPLPFEQTQIAAYLGRQTTLIDQKISLLQQKIDKYRELKKSLINEAVCRGLDKDVPMKDSGVEWIGEAPAHWGVRRMKDVSIVKRGASPRPIDDSIYFDDNGEFAWVRIRDITASERYLEKTDQRLSNLGASYSIKRFPGDLFLSIAGSVGKPIITKIKCCIHDGFVWFEKLNFDPEYLFYIFTVGSLFQGLGKLGTQLNLNTETIGLIQVPQPNRKEMSEIVNYLDKKTTQIDAIIANIQQQVATLQELRKTLINDIVTGKVKVSS